MAAGSKGAFDDRGVGKLLRYLALVVAALITTFPFYAMIVMSLKPNNAMRLPEALYPWGLVLDGYRMVIEGSSIFQWFINTVIYSVVGTILVLLLASAAAYAFAKLRFPGKGFMFWSMLAMLMVPYHVTLIPLFMMIARAGGSNTYWGLIAPTLANATAVYLMRQFIAALPDELLDAARIDGAGEWRIYWSIILPLCRPIMATLALFVFLWHWNDFLWPLVVAPHNDMRVLTTGIAAMQTQNVTLNQTLAGAVIALAPIFIAYLLAQRHFVEGMSLGAVKG